MAKSRRRVPVIFRHVHGDGSYTGPGQSGTGGDPPGPVRESSEMPPLSPTVCVGAGVVDPGRCNVAVLERLAAPTGASIAQEEGS